MIAKAGAEYFQGEGGCTQCHSPAGDLAGIGRRLEPDQPPAALPVPAHRAAQGPGAKVVTVTVTTESGQTLAGDLDRMDDFNVSFRDASGDLPQRPADAGHARRQDGSVRRARRAAVAHHRQEHPRRRRVSREPEMIRLGSSPAHARARWRTAAGAVRGPDPHGRVADLQRRLHGPPLQHAHEDQRRQRQAPRAWRGATGCRRPAPAPIKGDAARRQRHRLRDGAGSRVGDRRADGPRGLALRVEGQRRQPHRQPRRRHPRRLRSIS